MRPVHRYAVLYTLLATVPGCSLIFDAGDGLQFDDQPGSDAGGPDADPDRFQEPVIDDPVCDASGFASELSTIFTSLPDTTALEERCDPIDGGAFGVTIDSTGARFVQYPDKIDRQAAAGMTFDTAVSTAGEDYFYSLPRWAPEGPNSAALYVSEIPDSNDREQAQPRRLFGDGTSWSAVSLQPSALQTLTNRYRAFDRPYVNDGARVHFATTVDNRVARVFCDSDGCSDNPFGCESGAEIVNGAWLPSAVNPSYAFYLKDSGNPGSPPYGSQIEVLERQTDGSGSCSWVSRSVLDGTPTVLFGPPSIDSTGCVMTVVLYLDLALDTWLCRLDISE